MESTTKFQARDSERVSEALRSTFKLIVLKVKTIMKNAKGKILQ